MGRLLSFTAGGHNDLAMKGLGLPPVSGVVLVGGSSTRMGRPKQLLEQGGTSFVERAFDALAARVERVVLAGLGPVPEAIRGMTMLDDVPNVKGPLAGLLAAMQFKPESAWLVAACDMPFITAEAVGWLVEQRSERNLAVLPSVTAQRVEPLLAVYEPWIRPLLEDRAAAGWWGLQHLRRVDRVLCPEIPPDLARAWVNVNTPEEIRRTAGLDV